MIGVTEVRSVIWGEGRAAGARMVKVAVSGCNLWSGLAHQREDKGNAACALYCNADLVKGKVYSPEDLEAAASAAWGDHEAARRVFFTGGEPALSLTTAVLDAFGAKGWWIGVETNGTLPMLHLAGHADHITLSPKLDGNGALFPLDLSALDEVSITELKIAVSGKLHEPQWTAEALEGLARDFPEADLFVQPVDPPIGGAVATTFLRNMSDTSDAAVLAEVAWSRALRKARALVADGDGRWRLSFPHPLFARI